MSRSRSSVHRRTRSDIICSRTGNDLSTSPDERHSEGRVEWDEGTPPSGGHVVSRQMKQVVGDLVTVLGQLRTVVGDIRTLVSQIDIVTHKIDQSVSSDQSDRSMASSSNAKTGNRSTSSGSFERRRATTGRRSRDLADAADWTSHVRSEMTDNVCDLSSCFGNQQENDEKSIKLPPILAGRYPDDRRGERLSNHDRLYVTYKPTFSRHSIDKHPFPAAKRTATSASNVTSGPLIVSADVGKETLAKPKTLQMKSSSYITHIYENIKAFRRKTSPEGARKRVAPSTGAPVQTANIPTRRSGCLHLPAASPKLTRTERDPESANVRRSHSYKLIGHLHKAKTKTQQEYSGLYERLMEEKLELEFDDSLDLLDTLADIQTVDNDFEQTNDDFDDLEEPLPDRYAIDMIRKHADVVAWAQSAWPESRSTVTSVLCSDDPDDDTDSEWHEQTLIVPKSVNADFISFSWRPVIEP